MKKWRLIILLLCLLAAIAVWIVADAKGSRPAVHKVGMLKVGDSTNRVLEILGTPTEIATVRPGSAADIKGLPHITWFYGGMLDWQKPFTGDFPFIAPFRVRLVSDPDPRDVVVQFDTNGQICKIHGTR